MLKNNNGIIVFLLIIIWTLFFSIYKYFIWGLFETRVITLQFISGYLSIGTIIAYFCGGVIYEIFKEKKYHLFIIICAIILVIGILVEKKIGITDTQKIVSFFSIGLGFFYGLWGILKNILVSSLIQTSQRNETIPNGIANITFITCIIIGAIGGGFIAETFSIHGMYIIIGLLIIGLIVGFGLKNTQSTTKHIHINKRVFLKDLWFVIKKYFFVILSLSILLSIATLISQKAIEYNVVYLGKSISQSSLLLLYSVIGITIGNTISMKIENYKWYLFLLYCVLFASIILIFPYYITSFFSTGILTGIGGIFFGVTYNLIEACYLKMIADDNKKSQGSTALGIIMSIIAATMMFFTDFVQQYIGYHGAYKMMGCMVLFVGIIIYQIEGKLDS